jgi:hypothetical protein
VLNGDGFDLSYGSHDPYATSLTVVDTNYNPQTGNAIQKVTAVGVSLAATGDAAIIPIPSQITKYRVLGIDVGHCSGA